jgi:hypothetical protein
MSRSTVRGALGVDRRAIDGHAVRACIDAKLK